MVDSDTDEWEVHFGDCEYFGEEGSTREHHDADVQDGELLVAIRRNDTGFVHKAMEEGVPVNKVHRSGWNSLMHACDSGVSDVVELLLKHGADPKADIDSFSPLMAVCASRCNSENQLLLCASYLIENGADVNSRDRYQMTPLMFAGQHNRVHLVELLLVHKADADARDLRGWTALDYAAKNGDRTIMKLLLSGSSLDMYREDSVAPYPSGRHVYVAVDGLGDIASQQFLDLEVFLLGIQQQKTLPILKEHGVTLETLFTMTKEDLNQIGIVEVSVCKKILNAVSSVHKREWVMPHEKPSSMNVLSSSELVMTMCHLKKHIEYMQATCHMLIDGVSNNCHSLDWRMDVGSIQELVTEVNNLDEVTSRLRTQVTELKHKVQAVDFRERECSVSRKKRYTFQFILVGSVMCCGLYLLWKY